MPRIKKPDLNIRVDGLLQCARHGCDRQRWIDASRRLKDMLHFKPWSVFPKSWLIIQDSTGMIAYCPKHSKYRRAWLNG